MKNFNKNSIVTTTALVAFLMLSLTGPISVLAAGPASVNLGTAGNYAILAESLISTTGVTAVTGDLGISPFAATFVQGFSLTLDSTGCFSTSPIVTGKVYAADYNTGSCTTPAILNTAVGDMMIAYTDALSRPMTSGATLNVGGGEIGGQVLVPGVYTFTGTSINVLISTNVTLSGGANDVWIFQIPGTLNVASGADVPTGIKVLLTGGAQASNVFWAVTGATTLGTYSTFNGNILAATNIAMQTGAVLNGRALAQTAVTLDANTVTAPESVPVVTHTINASSGVNGSISPSGAVSVNNGANQLFTITANTGYHVADVLVDGLPVVTEGTYTFTNVTNDHTISVTFAVTPVAITVTADAKSKTYGDVDPVLTYTSSIPDVVFTGSLSRVAGENVGTYAITQGTLALNSNYNLTFVGANLKINFNVTIALIEAGKWTLISAPTLLNDAPTVTDDGSGAIALLVYENGVFATPSESNGDIIKPLSAFYVKTTNTGKVGLKFATISSPTQVSKQLSSGWNLVGTNNNGLAKNELSSIQNTQQNSGMVTLFVSDVYNSRKDVGYTSWVTDANQDLNANPITELPNKNLSKYDGYWVFMNAAKMFVKNL